VHRVPRGGAGKPSVRGGMPACRRGSGRARYRGAVRVARRMVGRESPTTYASSG
jgi:hypothetical protein